MLGRLLDGADPVAIAIVVFVEEAGVPIPVPTDLLMVLAGYQVAQGKMNLLWLLFTAELATVLGASLLYWIGARGGRPLLYRYGRFVHLDAPRLDRAGDWLRRQGWRAVFFGRLIFGLRVVTALAAGAFGVPYRVFFTAMALGGFLYIVVFVALGMFLGPVAIEVIEGLQLSIRALLTLVLFAALAVVFVTLYRRAGPEGRAPDPGAPERFESVALAGMLATLGMGMGVNLALYLLAAAGRGTPQQLLLDVLESAALRATGGVGPLNLGLFVALFFLGAVLWAFLYARVARERLPGPPWARGLLFSVLPLAASGLVALPLLGAGPFGLGLGAGLLPLAGEVFRHALFGVGLGIAYELLRGARPLPAPAYAA